MIFLCVISGQELKFINPKYNLPMKKIVMFFLFSFLFSGCDYFEKISDGYMVESESKSSTKITNINPKNSNSPKGIPCTVISFAYNDNHIIAAQKLNDCFNAKFNESEGITFWIIDVKKDKSYESLSLEDYLRTKDSIGVSRDLKLKL